MRISELARRAAVALSTVKYYLREELLPAGQATSATQADYDESHVERLRLIRVLVQVGGLSLAAVRDVLAAVDDGPDATPAAISAAHDALGGIGTRVSVDEPPRRALAAMERLGWRVRPESSALRDLEAALAAAEQVGIPAEQAQLEGYGAAALRVAEVDLGTVPAGAQEAVRHVVLGTVLYEPILLALRRLAQQHLFERQNETGPPSP